jgi:thiopurine S-methyltransferase
MQADFWHQKWQKNEIGFHLPDANLLLVKYFSKLQLKKGARVFLPLCGKTLDIAWLLAQGYRVAGAELSVIAIEDLFKSLNITPNIKTLSEIKHYSAANIDIFVGDIFKVSPAMLGAVDAVYDRAALVALPNEMRKLYTTHLQTLSNRETPLNHVPQLLICFEYDQTLHAGPPFSISADEVKQHYQTNYEVILLASEMLAGGLKAQTPALENVWLLKP